MHVPCSIQLRESLRSRNDSIKYWSPISLGGLKLRFGSFDFLPELIRLYFFVSPTVVVSESPPSLEVT